MKTFSQKCLLHIGEGRIRTIGLPKLNNESHRKKAASRRVSHSTCGGRTESSGADIKKGFSKRAAGGQGERRRAFRHMQGRTSHRLAGCRQQHSDLLFSEEKVAGGSGERGFFMYPLPFHLPTSPSLTPLPLANSELSDVTTSLEFFTAACCIHPSLIL